MQPRPWLFAALAALGLVAVAAAFFWPESEEERLRRATLDLVACPTFEAPAPSLVPYVARLQRCLTERLDEDAHLVIPEAGGTLPGSAHELARAAAPLVLTESSFRIDVLDLDVQVGARPEVRARVRVYRGSVRDAGERTLRLSFTPRDGEYLLRELLVEPNE